MNESSLEINILLMDDNFASRQAIKHVLDSLGKDSNFKFNIFSEPDGVSAIGATYLTKPTIVIVDLTLPTVSGKEFVDFIDKNSNSSLKVIVLTSENEKSNITGNYTIIDKKDSKFISKLKLEVGNFIKPNEYTVSRNIFKDFILSNILLISVLNDRLFAFVENSYLKGFLLLPLILLLQIAEAILLVVLDVVYGHIEDANLKQSSLDVKKYRVKHYPTFVGFFSAVVLLLIQASLFTVGGITIFNTKIDSIFAAADKRDLIEFNSGNASNLEYDPNLVVVGVNNIKINFRTDESLNIDSYPVDPMDAIRNFQGKQKVTPYVITSNPIYYSEIEDINLNSITTDKTEIKLQISNNKADWYFFNNLEGKWNFTTNQEISSNYFNDVKLNLKYFTGVSDTNKLYFKFFLISKDGVSTPVLKSLELKKQRSVIQSQNDSLKDLIIPEAETFTELSTLSFTDYEPVIFNASFFNGNKVVAGKIEPKDKSKVGLINYSRLNLDNFELKVYFTDELGDSLLSEIGTTNLYINQTGDLSFKLIAPSTAGGFVTVRVFDKSNENNFSDLAKPVENSTFTVDSTAEGNDDTLDGLCATTLGECTIIAALEEANNVTGADNIYFNIPTSDPGYRDYDDPLTPSSGDSLDGDDYWLFEMNSIDPPVIIETVTIDGATQTSNQSDSNTIGPEIQFLNVDTVDNLFTLSTSAADNSTITNISASEFSVVITIEDVSNVTIQSNYLSDVRGLNSGTYNETAIKISGTSSSILIGGTNVTDRNLLYGLIMIDGGTAIDIYNNYINTTADGLSKGSNNTLSTGIFIAAIQTVSGVNIGNGSSTGRNVIVGNLVSLYIIGSLASDIEVRDNYIGVGADGQTSLPISTNSTAQVHIEDGAELISIANNVIGINDDDIQGYVYIESGCGVGLDGNYIGTFADGSKIDSLTQDDVDAAILIADDPPTTIATFPYITINNNLIKSNEIGIKVSMLKDNGIVSITENTISESTIGIHYEIFDSSGLGGVADPLEGNIDNNFIGSSAQEPGGVDPHFGLAVGANTRSGIILNEASPVVRGNKIIASEEHGIFIKAGDDMTQRNSLPSLERLSRPGIGGTDAFAGSLCNGLEQNCIWGNLWDGIYSLDTIPANESTLWDDNDFSNSNGDEDQRNIVQVWKGLFEVFSDTNRRTDLSGISLDFPATSLISTSDGPSRASTGQAFPKACLNASADCPLSGDTEGVDGETSILSSDGDAFLNDYLQYWYYITEYVIDDTGTINNYGTLTFDENNIVSEPFSFDGDATTHPVNTGDPRVIDGQNYDDRGEPWTNNPAATRNIVTGDFSRFQVMEVEIVDANPYLENGNYVIYANSNGNTNNVSTELVNTGQGVASGGGRNGPDGMADGFTTLTEAVIAAKNFSNQNVVISFTGDATEFGNIFKPANPITLVSPITTNQVTINGGNATFDGSDQPPGTPCIEVTGAYNLAITNMVFLNCKTNAIKISGGRGISLNPEMFKNDSSIGIPIDLVGGTEDGNGVTQNDSGDSDTGPNLLMNSPNFTVNYIGGGTYQLNGNMSHPDGEGPITVVICISDNHPSGYGGCESVIGSAQSNSPWSFNYNIPGDDGTQNRNFTALATNALGNTSEFAIKVSTLDSDPNYDVTNYPITLVAPQAQANVTDTTPLFDWNASADPDLGHYELFVDGTYRATIASNTTAFDYNLGALSLGNHTWQVRGIRSNSSVGGVSEVRSFSIVTPTVAQPSNAATIEIINITYPYYGSTIDDSTPTIKWNIPEDFTFDHFELYLDGILVTNLTSNLDSYEFTNNLKSGEHTVKIFAKDINGEILGESQEIKFSIIQSAALSFSIGDLKLSENGVSEMLININLVGYVTNSSLVFEIKDKDGNTLYKKENISSDQKSLLLNVDDLKGLKRGQEYSLVLKLIDNDSQAIITQSSLNIIPKAIDRVVNVSNTIEDDNSGNSIQDSIKESIDTIVANTPEYANTFPLVATGIVNVTLVTASGANRIGLLIGLFVFKRKKYWGLVYDADLYKGIPFAKIVVYDSKGKFVRDAITDLDGRYGILLENLGEYWVNVKASGFESSEKTIKITSFDVAIDFALTKVSDLSDLKFIEKLRLKFFLNKDKFLNILRIVNIAFIAFGLLYTALLYFQDKETKNLIILLIYMVFLAVLIFKLITSRRRIAGRIIDNQAEPIEGVVARFYQQKEKRQLNILVTNGYGELKINLKKGVYLISAYRSGYKEIRLDKVEVNTKGHLAKNIVMSKGSDSKEVNPFS